jgi:3-oxoacyl-[acyl-carrier protein] reductase
MAAIDEQNVIITGANRGIGRVMAERFVQEGAHVGLLGRRRDAVEDTIDSINDELSPSGSMSPIVADVSEAEDVDEAIDEWIEERGTIHTLINNAGITRDGLLMRMDDEDWESVLDTNLDGAFYCTKAVVRNMMRNRWGRIIMVSSVIGLTGNPGQSNYAASKSGMIGFSKSVARELGSRGVTSNTIAPGYIETEMTDEMDEENREAILENTPAERLGEADDVADCALFLASERADYITGEVIRVDGGLAM